MTFIPRLFRPRPVDPALAAQVVVYGTEPPADMPAPAYDWTEPGAATW